MITFKNSKKYLLVILAAEFLMGIYMAVIRMNYSDSFSFVENFLSIKDGADIDISSDFFDFNVVMSVMNIIVSIPMLAPVFHKKYLTKCSYIATRQGSYIKFYFNEITNIFVLCVLCEFLYCTGISIIAYIKSEHGLIDIREIKLLLIAVINSIIILFTVVLIGSLLSVMINDKVSIIIMITVVTVFSVIIFFISVELRQYNIITWYFTDYFVNNKNLFPYPIPVYYVALAAIDICICLFGCLLLKRKDVI